MRPGSRWNGEAANPIAAAIYGAVVSLLLGYGLSYLFSCLKMGILIGPGAWNGYRIWHLAGLNLYACQHVPLLGSGVTPGDGQPIRAFMSLPLTMWAAIPAFALTCGGFVCARMRAPAGRWGMTASAILSGVIYAGVLVGLSFVVAARFASTAIPAISGWELTPPDIAFRPSVRGALGYGLLFGVVFSYLGALIAVRAATEAQVRGKWWACAKAVVVVGVVVQLLMCGAMLGWSAAKARSGEVAEYAQAEVVQVLPTVVGTGYSLVYGSKFRAAAVPVAMPSARYGVELEVYRGVKRISAGTTTRSGVPPYAMAIAALIGAIAALASGRLAVKYGSRDGSLPTGIRILVLQAAYLAVTMVLCRIAWGIVGQSAVTIGPVYGTAMLIAAGCVFVLSLVGAHSANRAYAGRLAGLPSA